ncbi:methyl-accepting chemotaxis protein [Agarilytica rhodophyticola]|uniref:methyl-accepting chemotaxis protein n=1 Tax=Agarilytica rhodophyticola TaxID=1737490 RepID=UPI000B349A7F|nr:methyl-accepting chemotaxis protein [Agarilytica rhodophyticola]
MLLSKVKIKNKLLLLTVIPIIATFFLSFLLLKGFIQEYNDSKKANKIIKIVNILDNIAHQHAVERGLTAGYLGNRNERTKAKVIDQRKKADTTIQALEKLIQNNEFSTLIPQKQLSNFQTFILKKKKIQNQVDNITSYKGAFKYYSDLNKQALDIIAQVVHIIKQPTLRSELNQLISLLWMKEKAGQSRGAINGALAKGSTSVTQYSSIKGYIEAFESRLSLLLLYDDTFSYSDIKNLEARKIFSDVVQHESNFLNNTKDLSKVSGIAPSDWFALATQRIKAIKKIANELADYVSRTSDNMVSKQYTNLIIVIVSVLFVSIVAISLLIFIGIDIVSRTKQCNSILNTSINNFDLTLRIPEKGDDELSFISHGINEYIDWMGKLIASINTVINTLDKQVVIFFDQVKKNKTSLDDQQNQTQQIAAAITQMSASMNQVSDSCKEAAEHSKQSSANIQQTRLSTEKTSSEALKLSQKLTSSQDIIKKLSDDSENIGGILDTIRGIAEQTNLLALNAAIEAARAGEQGRGFAVVADEVRSLAQRTQESTEEIQQMIESLRLSAEKATGTMQQSRAIAENCLDSAKITTEKINETEHLINDTDNLVIQIATATEQQYTASDEVAAAIERINSLCHESFDISQQVENSGNDLNTVAIELRDNIKDFKFS